jgi:hypothetical protein
MGLGVDALYLLNRTMTPTSGQFRDAVNACKQASNIFPSSTFLELCFTVPPHDLGLPCSSPGQDWIDLMFRVVFWVVLPYCTSETSVDNHFTRQYNPEDSAEHHTRRRENLKSHMD